MLAATASHLSPSDMGRRCNKENTKGGSKLESWRVRKGEGSKEANVPRVYGGSMPPEWKLQRLYKRLKTDNTNFTTWLVESVHPTIESLPPYITLSRKQAKDYAKYDITVNNMTELARQTQNVPPDMVALLDRLIDERTEYSYWMVQKSTDDTSKFSNESHAYYIKVLKEPKTILAERMDPAATTAAPAQRHPSSSKTTTTPSQPNIKTLGKRKTSSASLPGPDPRKAAKTESTPSTPEHILKNGANASAAAQKQQQQQQDEWRQVVASSCYKTSEKKCVPAAKPMSYAAALRVAITT